MRIDPILLFLLGYREYPGVLLSPGYGINICVQLDNSKFDTSITSIPSIFIQPNHHHLINVLRYCGFVDYLLKPTHYAIAAALPDGIGAILKPKQYLDFIYNTKYPSYNLQVLCFELPDVERDLTMVLVNAKDELAAIHALPSFELFRIGIANLKYLITMGDFELEDLDTLNNIQSVNFNTIRLNAKAREVGRDMYRPGRDCDYWTVDLSTKGYPRAKL